MQKIIPIHQINAVILAENICIYMPEQQKQIKLNTKNAEQILNQKPLIGCHFPTIYARLQVKNKTQNHLDLAELFAFIKPTQFVLPTLDDIAQAIDLIKTDSPNLPHKIAQTLLQILLQKIKNQKYNRHIVHFMHNNQWAWAPYIIQMPEENNPQKHNKKSIDEQKNNTHTYATIPHLNLANREEIKLPQIINHITEWKEEYPAKTQNKAHNINEKEAEKLLKYIIKDGNLREKQFEYTKTASEIFNENQREKEKNIQLLEAETGLGKTLAYLTPAYLANQKTNTPIWVSTYTKNLQRQIYDEAKKIYPHNTDEKQNILIRKGNENYLCLRKMENIINSEANSFSNAENILLALMTQWVLNTKNGDITGPDFLSWIFPLVKYNYKQKKAQNTFKITDLTLTHGECTRNACPHFKKCFLFKNKNKIKNAKLIIANHALIITNALNNDDGNGDGEEETQQNEEKNSIPKYIIFDEAHHIFDAADSATATRLTHIECQKIKANLLEYDIQNTKNLNSKNTIKQTLIKADKKDPNIKILLKNMNQIVNQLPDKTQKINTPAEQFFNQIYKYVIQNDPNRQEAEYKNPSPSLLKYAEQFQNQIENLNQIIHHLIAKLNGIIKNHQNPTDENQKQDKNQYEAIANTLERNQNTLNQWKEILENITNEENQDKQNQDKQNHFQWCFLNEGQNEKKQYYMRDVGIYRHALDPTKIFAEKILKNITGAVITSATLQDTALFENDIRQNLENWKNAEMRTGAAHLPWVITRKHFKSPFNYRENAKFIVVNDVNYQNANAVAHAYQKLFIAANGGALGLFTAIKRLKITYQKISKNLIQNGINLYAQHIDHIDTATLIDMFRNDINASILGTDALRDGINVPGKSLRLIVMERVPWARPTLLEKKRQKTFPKWQDINVRLKLRQAFGRLIRSENDKGIFIILDNRYQKKFNSMLPDGIIPQRKTLNETVNITQDFFK